MNKKGKEEVGKNVKLARDKKSAELGHKYTQIMLSKDTGISQGYLSDIESGRSYPSRKASIAIAEACGVSLDFIMGTETESKDYSKPAVLENIKRSFSEILDIVYLPVIGCAQHGKPLFSEENIETYIPHTREYDQKKHFVLRVQDDSMKDSGILSNDLVVIRRQDTAENGQIVALLHKNKGLMLKKYSSKDINEDITVIGVAISITKKLS